MTKPLLLVQPLKIGDISINILADEEDEEQQEEQAFLYQTDTTTINNVIDDAELLAILGFPPPPPLQTCHSELTTPTLSFIDSNTLLDWQDMPELSESEDDITLSHTKKRKSTITEEEDIFAQFDFEEVNLLYQHQVVDQQQQQQNNDNKKFKTNHLFQQVNDMTPPIPVFNTTTNNPTLVTDFDF